MSNTQKLYVCRHTIITRSEEMTSYYSRHVLVELELSWIMTSSIACPDRLA